MAATSRSVIAIGGPVVPSSSDPTLPSLTPDSTAAFINREVSWLSFARRVLALAEDPAQPLLERVKFAGIMGMIYDEFAMKRLGGLFRRVRRDPPRRGPDGLTPAEELAACRAELRAQQETVAGVVEKQLRPALRDLGAPIVDVGDLEPAQRDDLARYFVDCVEPILTPLAADAAHPFPFISNLGLNLGVLVTEPGRRKHRFVRIKVPANRPRWVPLRDDAGWVPIEQVIADNLGVLFPRASRLECHFFRITRGAKDDPWTDQIVDEDADLTPGAIIGMVTAELTARKYAGVVRLEVSAGMPAELRDWLAAQLNTDPADVLAIPGMLALGDLMRLPVPGHADQRDPPHEPVTHPRLRHPDHHDPSAIFDEIRRGDLLVHLPYHSFETSILRFLRSAAADPSVLAIKLTIYRTSRRSPIIEVLKEAARSGKQVAVLVEITARFDEAPNIGWGRELEQAGAHVAYGVERVKTHVKLALVVREEADGLRRYVHVGTGNYHEGTARLYEDLGLLTADPDLAAHAAAVFNELTAGIPAPTPGKLLVAPHDLRERFTELIRREARHARAGRPSGIRAKMNQLQDPQMIRELYGAGLAGVPIVLNVRGLCCLRAGVPGLSPTIRVFSVVGRFLEHSRIYRFENGGTPEFYIGSADLMTRNLSRRMEVVAPVGDPVVKAELEEVLRTYEQDNCSAWDMRPDGEYVRRHPDGTEACRSAQQVFIERCAATAGSPV
ncbi:polyphosphate kinase 1 [Actinoplanes sp. NPDC049316]|uniref:polyphosphate kinase 1 n=1 Tax=Actinoplanes sp. NPDC049316 TaxID=3154727 RepID=UPI00342647AF